MACALIIGCGDDGDPGDVIAPEIVSTTPGDGDDGVWLHDQFEVEFSEPIDPATVDTDTLRLIDADGADLTGDVTLDADGVIARVRAADDATALGALRLDVSDEVADLAGNRLAAQESFSWTLPGWTIQAVDLGENAQVPGIGLVGDLIVVASSVDDGTRIVASDGSGAPIGGDIATGNVVLPVAAADGDSPVVAWWNVDAMTVDAARWDGTDWEALPSPGSGSLPVLASSPGGALGIVWVNLDGDVDAAVLDGSDWVRVDGTPILATTVVGRPAIAMPSDSQVIAGFLDRVPVPGPSLTERIDVRVVPLGVSSGSAGLEPPVLTLAALPPADAGFNRINVTASGDRIAVAWDEFSGHGFSANAAELVNGAWTIFPALDVDPPGNATGPDIRFDADGTVVATWLERIEGDHRGFAARWTGAAWETIGGDAWSGPPERTHTRGSSVLWRDRVPVVAYNDVTAGDGIVRIARFNGPGAPRLGRQAALPVDGCAFDPSAPPATLSATGCFTIDGGQAIAHAGLIPYDLVSELWTDGALKRRWLGLGTGGLTELVNGSLDAPAGSLVIKEFAIGDPGARQAVETRFLVRTSGGWTGFNYQWRTDGSDADLLPGAASSTVAWDLPGGTTYTHFYPSRTDCARCHNSTVGPLLGVRRDQLARRFDYDGVLDDQLRVLAQLGALVDSSNAAPAAIPAPHDPRESLERRVRGYLAANCAHCHSPTGERPTRDFRLDTPLANTGLCGVVTPGNPGSSVVMTRLSNRPGMPPIGTLQTDPLILDVMAAWITSIASCP